MKNGTIVNYINAGAGNNFYTSPDSDEYQRDVRTDNTYDADQLIRSISYSKTYAVADGPENG